MSGRDFAGHADNQLVWSPGGAPRGSFFDQTPMALELVDRWMANIGARPNRTVAQNKPSDAIDACSDVNGEFVFCGAGAWNGILDDGPDGPGTEESRCTRPRGSSRGRPHHRQRVHVPRTRSRRGHRLGCLE